MGGKVSMVADGFYIIVNVRIHMRSTLFVINTALDDVKQMRNHAACREPLSLIVEIKPDPVPGAAPRGILEQLGIESPPL